jgi:hypothetical protein
MPRSRERKGNGLKGECRTDALGLSRRRCQFPVGSAPRAHEACALETHRSQDGDMKHSPIAARPIPNGRKAGQSLWLSGVTMTGLVSFSSRLAWAPAGPVWAAGRSSLVPGSVRANGATTSKNCGTNIYTLYLRVSPEDFTRVERAIPLHHPA